MIAEQRTQDRTWSQIVARAWADGAFKDRLILDPETVLREHGVELPFGVQARVIENAKAIENIEGVHHFVLPPSPAGELSEEELSPTAPAYSYSGWCHHSYRCGRCGCGCYDIE